MCTAAGLGRRSSRVRRARLEPWERQRIASNTLYSRQGCWRLTGVSLCWLWRVVWKLRTSGLGIVRIRLEWSRLTTRQQLGNAERRAPSYDNQTHIFLVAYAVRIISSGICTATGVLLLTRVLIPSSYGCGRATPWLPLRRMRAEYSVQSMTNRTNMLTTHDWSCPQHRWRSMLAIRESLSRYSSAHALNLESMYIAKQAEN